MATAEAEALAKSARGAMVAAAGCGKTQVIAAAVANHGGKRELILTHTHAGVDAIRGRLREFAVPSQRCRVDTLAGWALRLAASFPASSRLSCVAPRASSEYDQAYAAAVRLLRSRPIQQVIRASYSGIYVDEYQDCTVSQHGLVVALRDIVPCRVVGDPLQGIFDFGDNVPVSWSAHVERDFDAIPGPETPWRWRRTNPRLGAWLQTARQRLRKREPLDLKGAPLQWVAAGTGTDRRRRESKACFDARNRSADRVIAIMRWPNQCHALASRLRGSYSCVEAIDTKALYEYASRIDATEGHARAVAVIDFAAACMTQVKTSLKGARAMLEKGKTPRGKKFELQQDALMAVANARTIAPIDVALHALSQVPDAFVYRRELLQEMLRAIRAVQAGEAETLGEAAWIVRNRTRRVGRRLPRCAVGTTQLVKGLEFEHAVVLDADTFDAPNLYVALTRGSRSLTVVSESGVLRPKSGR